MGKVTTAANSTRWSLIVRAQGHGEGTRAALGELLAHYEKFVVWLIRHHGHPPDSNAEELKQDFLEGVLRRNDIAKLDPARGSFRGWLGLAVRRFLLNEWDKWRAASAGRKGTVPIGLETIDGEALPDNESEREFACHVVLHALSLHAAKRVTRSASMRSRGSCPVRKWTWSSSGRSPRRSARRPTRWPSRFV